MNLNNQEDTTCIFLSYYFPPINSVGVIRNYFIANLLCDIFPKLQIFTTSNQRLLPKEEVNLDKFKNVHLLKTFDYRTIFQYFIKNNKTIHYSETLKKPRILRWLIRVNESIPFNLWLGEGGLCYILDAYLRMNRIIKTSGNKIIIITTFRPTANIVIGYLLKRKYPSIKWITSFQDTPYDPYRKNLILPVFQIFFWKQVLKYSQQNISTSIGIKKELDRYCANSEVFLSGIEFRQPLLEHVKQFTITYTGSLYEDYRDPTLLFEAIQHLVQTGDLDIRNIKIIYVGKDIDLWRGFCRPYPILQKAFIIEGLAARDYVLIQQQKSHVNLLLNWSWGEEGGTMPAKLFEYIGAGNYIIALIKGNKSSALSQFMEQMNMGEIFSYEEPNVYLKLSSTLLNLYTQWLSGNYHPPKIPETLRKLLGLEHKQKELVNLLFNKR
jgi:hypothetical protein